MWQVGLQMGLHLGKGQHGSGRSQPFGRRRRALGTGFGQQLLRSLAAGIFAGTPCRFGRIRRATRLFGGGEVGGDALVALVDRALHLGHHAEAHDEEHDAEGQHQPEDLRPPGRGELLDLRHETSRIGLVDRAPSPGRNRPVRRTGKSGAGKSPRRASRCYATKISSTATTNASRPRSSAAAKPMNILPC